MRIQILILGFKGLNGHFQFQIQGRAPPPLFLDQTGAQKAKKNFSESAPMLLY